MVCRCDEYKSMLEDIVSELDLSEAAIARHGPMGTSPVELVRLVLEEKDRIIFRLGQGVRIINTEEVKKTSEYELRTELTRLHAELTEAHAENARLDRVRRAAQEQSEEVQCNWLSPAEAEGLRRQLAATEKQAQMAGDALD